MPKIFISYGRDGSHGQNLATQAQQQLQDAGFDVFRDVNGLKPGDVWYSKLEFELDSSDLVVLVISEKIRTSEWVHNEISMAKEIGLPIIPVIAEQIRMPIWLRHLQTLDFSVQADWKVLLNAAGGHIGLPERPQEVDISVSSSRDNPKDVGTMEADETSKRTGIIRIKDQIPNWASHAGEDQYGHYADLDVNNVTQRFRLIKSGTFLMGSPTTELGREDVGKETQHLVTISSDFWLADTACTQSLWQVVMGNNPSCFTDNYLHNPVETVSWSDTQVFFERLTTINPKFSFQLPTEAQWEYACRAASGSPFSFGNKVTPEQVNYDGNFPYGSRNIGIYRESTLAVKALLPNNWGLYEMHGNVWEWCKDFYREDLGSDSIADPENKPSLIVARVIRGGSWDSDCRDCRSATRDAERAEVRSSSVGFRLQYHIS